MRRQLHATEQQCYVASGSRGSHCREELPHPDASQNITAEATALLGDPDVLGVLCSSPSRVGGQQLLVLTFRRPRVGPGYSSPFDSLGSDQAGAQDVQLLKPPVVLGDQLKVAILNHPAAEWKGINREARSKTGCGPTVYLRIECV